MDLALWIPSDLHAVDTEVGEAPSQRASINCSSTHTIRLKQRKLAMMESVKRGVDWHAQQLRSS